MRLARGSRRARAPAGTSARRPQFGLRGAAPTLVRRFVALGRLWTWRALEAAYKRARAPEHEEKKFAIKASPTRNMAPGRHLHPSQRFNVTSPSAGSIRRGEGAQQKAESGAPEGAPPSSLPQT